MSTLTSKYSLAEQAKRVDPDGKLSRIVEALDLEMGDILSEAPWLPSNDTWTNKSVRRGSLPTGSWRKLNSGVATEVSRVTEVLDVLGMLETYSEYDKEWIDNMPDPLQARFEEAMAFVEGLSHTLMSTILYGNANLDPDQMHGLSPRLSTVDSKYILNSGGSGGDTTSIFAVTWDNLGAHFIYPKNSDAQLGIRHKDLGEVTLTDATTLAPNTSQYQGYRDHFQVKCGLVVRDPRCIGRVGNIEVSGADNLFDEDDLIVLLEYLKVRAGTRLYGNQKIRTQAQIRLKDKANVNWSTSDGLTGVPIVSFQGIPFKKIDEQILINAESAIS